MNQNTRLYILLGILAVLLVAYGLSVLGGNGDATTDLRTANAREISDINRSSGGLIEEKSYSINTGIPDRWRDDPFDYIMPSADPSNPFSALLGDLPLASEELKLKGIVWQNNVPTVLINNEVLKVGDEINGYRIASVGQDFVTLRNNTERLQLSLGE